MWQVLRETVLGLPHVSRDLKRREHIRKLSCWGGGLSTSRRCQVSTPSLPWLRSNTLRKEDVSRSGCLKAEQLYKSEHGLRSPPQLPKRAPETLHRHSCLRHELAEASRFMNKVIQLIVDGGLVMFKDTNKMMPDWCLSSLAVEILTSPTIDKPDCIISTSLSKMLVLLCVSKL